MKIYANAKKGERKLAAIQRLRTSSCWAPRRMYEIRLYWFSIGLWIRKCYRSVSAHMISEWRNREKGAENSISFSMRRRDFVAVRLVLAKQICTDFTWGFLKKMETPLLYLWHVKRVFHPLLILSKPSFVRFAGNAVASTALTWIVGEIRFHGEKNCTVIVLSFAIAIHSLFDEMNAREFVFGHTIVQCVRGALHLSPSPQWLADDFLSSRRFHLPPANSISAVGRK